VTPFPFLNELYRLRYPFFEPFSPLVSTFFLFMRRCATGGDPLAFLPFSPFTAVFMSRVPLPFPRSAKSFEHLFQFNSRRSLQVLVLQLSLFLCSPDPIPPPRNTGALGGRWTPTGFPPLTNLFNVFVTFRLFLDFKPPVLLPYGRCPPPRVFPIERFLLANTVFSLFFAVASAFVCQLSAHGQPRPSFSRSANLPSFSSSGR